MIPTWRRYYLRYKSFFLQVFRQYQLRPDVKAYLEIILSLVAISIFAIFAIRPAVLTIGNLYQEIQSKKITLSTLNQKIENLEKAKIIYEEQEQRITYLKESIPENPNPQNLFIQIEANAKKDSALLNSFDLNPIILYDTKNNPDQNLSPQLLSFTSQTTSRYLNAVNFIKTLQSLRRPVKIKTLNLKAVNEEGAEDVSLSFEADSPFLKLKTVSYENK